MDFDFKEYLKWAAACGFGFLLVLGVLVYLDYSNGRVIRWDMYITLALVIVFVLVPMGILASPMGFTFLKSRDAKTRLTFATIVFIILGVLIVCWFLFGPYLLLSF